MTYDVVFDIAREGYKYWYHIPIGLAFVAVGLAVAYVERRSSVPVEGVDPTHVGALIATAAGLILAVVFTVNYIEYRANATALREGHYHTVEGAVHDFRPMPRHDSWHGRWGCTLTEEFTVSGVRFAYSGHRWTSGFNRDRNVGGRIKNGLRVRIAHSANTILRLEAAQQQLTAFVDTCDSRN